MKAPLILVLLTSVFACTSRVKTLRALDFGPFELGAPKDWRMLKKQGDHNYTGGLTNGADTCWIDYGRYNVEFPTDSGYRRWLTEDTVSGFRAIFSVPDSGQQGFVSMMIPSLSNGDRFVIWASKVKDRSTVLQIYKSAIFPGSDTAVNPPLADVKHFEPTNEDGKALFVVKCQVCHPMWHIVDGPRIQELIATRNAEWLYRFFTDRTFRANNRFHQLMKKDFGNVECIEMPTMTKSEAIALFYYIKSLP